MGLKEQVQELRGQVDRLLGRADVPPPVDRPALAAERATLIRDRDRELPGLWTVVERARAARLAAWANYQAAEAAEWRAVQQRRGRAGYYDRQLRRVEADLTASADPAIAAFVAETYDLANAVRQEPAPGSAAEREHAVARLAAITAARDAALALALEADADPEQRLDAIRATIPGRLVPA